MRRDREDAVQHEADELASEAFDRYPPEVEQWVRDAFVGEWDRNSESAAKEVMAAAANFALYSMLSPEPYADAVARLRRAVEQLREAYVEHASEHGLYAAEAEDNINCAISDEAERARDMEADIATEAYQSVLRG